MDSKKIAEKIADALEFIDDDPYDAGGRTRSGMVAEMVKVLEAELNQEWILVSEGLPLHSRDVDVTLEFTSPPYRRRVAIARWIEESRVWVYGVNGARVICWRERPIAYQPEAQT